MNYKHGNKNERIWQVHMYIFYTSSKLYGVSVQADGSGWIQGVAGQYLAQGAPPSLQQQVHAPAIANPRNRRFQWAQHLQAGYGQSLSKDIQGLLGLPGRIALGAVEGEGSKGRVAQAFPEGQLRGGKAFEILGQGEGFSTAAIPVDGGYSVS